MSTQPDQREPRHPMRLVVERTGLSPDVLRAWERRYGVVTPARSGGGQRLYSDADLERLELLVRATRSGHAVSRIASLPLDALRQLIAADAEHRAARPTPAADYRAEAYAAVAALQSERLRVALRSALLALGLSAFLHEVVAPLMQRIGEAWHAGEIGIAHEHAATAVVRGLLGSLMETLDVPASAPRIVLGCLSGEHHELGAALAAVTAAQAGWRVAYLGPDVPTPDITLAVLRLAADAVGVSIVAPADGAAARLELRSLRGQLPPRVRLFAGGAAAFMLGSLADGITLARDLAHWRTLLHASAPIN